MLLTNDVLCRYSDFARPYTEFIPGYVLASDESLMAHGYNSTGSCLWFYQLLQTKSSLYEQRGNNLHIVNVT